MGLLIYCTLLFTIIRTVKNSLKTVDAVALPLLRAFVFSLCILVMDIMFTMPYMAWNVIWIFIGLMLGLKATSIEADIPTPRITERAPAKKMERATPSYYRLRGNPT